MKRAELDAILTAMLEVYARDASELEKVDVTANGATVRVQAAAPSDSVAKLVRFFLGQENRSPVEIASPASRTRPAGSHGVMFSWDASAPARRSAVETCGSTSASRPPASRCR